MTGRGSIRFVRIAAVTSALVLAGCASDEQRQKRIAAEIKEQQDRIASLEQTRATALTVAAIALFIALLAAGAPVHSTQQAEKRRESADAALAAAKARQQGASIRLDAAIAAELDAEADHADAENLLTRLQP